MDYLAARLGTFDGLGMVVEHFDAGAEVFFGGGAGLGGMVGEGGRGEGSEGWVGEGRAGDLAFARFGFGLGFGFGGFGVLGAHFWGGLVGLVRLLGGDSWVCERMMLI